MKISHGLWHSPFTAGNERLIGSIKSAVLGMPNAALAKFGDAIPQGIADGPPQAFQAHIQAATAYPS